MCKTRANVNEGYEYEIGRRIQTSSKFLTMLVLHYSQIIHPKNLPLKHRCYVNVSRPEEVLRVHISQL